MNPELSTDDFDPRGFSGKVRVFPLPAVSLFPGVVLPLHIYEPRYRALVEAALDSDQLIAMATLKPGWQSDYHGRPPLEPTACLGKIATHHRFEDGKYNLLMVGVARIQLNEEMEPPEAFRRFEAELLKEETEVSISELAPLGDELVDLFRKALPSSEIPEQLQSLFEPDTPLSLLADLTAYSLPISHEAKLRALAEANVKKRSEELIVAVNELVSQQSDQPNSNKDEFPPSFSDN